MNKSCLACEAGEWHLHVWDPLDPSAFDKHVAWQCRSWRHDGNCRRWKGAQDFTRISQAIASRIDWTVVTLTYAQKDWPSPWAAYKAGVFLWAKLRKRITAKWGRMEYIQTWEKHTQSDFPHMNLAIGNEPLFIAVSKDYRLPRRWLRKNAVESGFGSVIHVKAMYDGPGLAGYFSKLSRELTGSDIKGQVPVNAPPHFRRIRASRGTLPPIIRSELTGRLLQTPLESWERFAMAQRHEYRNPEGSESGVNLDAE